MTAPAAAASDTALRTLRNALANSIIMAALTAGLLAWHVATHGWGPWQGLLLGAAFGALTMALGFWRAAILIVLGDIALERTLGNGMYEATGAGFLAYYLAVHGVWAIVLGATHTALRAVRHVVRAVDEAAQP